MVKKILIICVGIIVIVLLAYLVLGKNGVNTATQTDVVSPVSSTSTNDVQTQMRVLTVPASSTPVVNEYVQKQINVLESAQPSSPPSEDQRADILKALQAK